MPGSARPASSARRSPVLPAGRAVRGSGPRPRRRPGRRPRQREPSRPGLARRGRPSWLVGGVDHEPVDVVGVPISAHASLWTRAASARRKSQVRPSWPATFLAAAPSWPAPSWRPPSWPVPAWRRLLLHRPAGPPVGQQLGGPLVGELLHRVAPAQRGVGLTVGDVRAEPAVLDHHRLARGRVHARVPSTAARQRLAGRAAWAGRRSPAPASRVTVNSCSSDSSDRESVPRLMYGPYRPFCAVISHSLTEPSSSTTRSTPTTRGSVSSWAASVQRHRLQRHGP